MSQRFSLYEDLTVEENVKVGLHHHLHTTIFDAVLRLPRYWREAEDAHEQATKLLRTMGLLEVAHLGAEELPYGLRRRLERGRREGENTMNANTDGEAGPAGDRVRVAAAFRGRPVLEAQAIEDVLGRRTGGVARVGGVLPARWQE